MTYNGGRWCLDLICVQRVASILHQAPHSEVIARCASLGGRTVGGSVHPFVCSSSDMSARGTALTHTRHRNIYRASSLDEGASTGDGQLMERGCGACGVFPNGSSGGCALPVSAASHRRGRRSERPGEPRPGPPTATTSGCHRMAQGRGAEQAARAAGNARPGTGKVRRAPSRSPLPEARRSGLKTAAAGAGDGA